MHSIGGYQVLAELGAGGMGVIYLARQVGPGGFEKLVAIKRVHPHLAHEPEVAAMFLDEARIAARIQHRNVAQVFNLGVDEDESPYLVMEFMEGAALDELVDAVGGPLAPNMVAKIGAEAARGLHAAHTVKDLRGRELEVIHRDVSPHNIFLMFDGAVKLTDFGIARARNRLPQTDALTLKGKAAYMAPEQIRGDAIDRRVDIFALGIVLWELTTGRRLFGGKSQAESLLAVTLGNIPQPSEYVECPPVLEAIILRALALEPDDRFASAKDLAVALQDFARDLPAADLEALMEAKLATRRAEIALLLRNATATPPPVVPRVSRGVESNSGVTETSATSAAVATGARSPDTAAAAGPSARRGLLGLAGVGIFLLGMAGAFAFGTTREEEREVASMPRAAGAPAVGAESEAGSGSGAASASGTESESGSGSETETEYGTETETETETESESESETGTETKSEPETETGPESEVGARGSGGRRGRRADSAMARMRMAGAMATMAAETVAAETMAAETSVSVPMEAPRAELPGHLDLSAVPWARVSIDGQAAGRTPIIHRALAPGVHQIQLWAQGEGNPETLRIRIRSGETTARRVVLTQ